MYHSACKSLDFDSNTRTRSNSATQNRKKRANSKKSNTNKRSTLVIATGSARRAKITVSEEPLSKSPDPPKKSAKAKTPARKNTKNLIKKSATIDSIPVRRSSRKSSKTGSVCSEAPSVISLPETEAGSSLAEGNRRRSTRVKKPVQPFTFEEEPATLSPVKEREYVPSNSEESEPESDVVSKLEELSFNSPKKRPAKTPKKPTKSSKTPKPASNPKMPRYSLRHVNLIRDEINEDTSSETSESDPDEKSENQEIESDEADKENTNPDQFYNFQNTDKYFKAMKNSKASNNDLADLEKIDAFDLSRGCEFGNSVGFKNLFRRNVDMFEEMLFYTLNNLNWGRVWER